MDKWLKCSKCGGEKFKISFFGEAFCTNCGKKLANPNSDFGPFRDTRRTLPDPGKIIRDRRGRTPPRLWV